MSAESRPATPTRPRERSPFVTVAVVGCGLIGASFARASQLAPGVERVTTTDRSAHVRQRARHLGIGTTVVDDVTIAVADADLVVLAIPLDAIPGVAAQILPCMKTQAILTDTGSLKLRSTAEVEALLGSFHVRSGVAVRYIGGHPMAGSERSGIDAADGTIFQGATWLLTPTAGSDDDAFHALATHLRTIGARVLALTPEGHDRLVAVASHLPQLLSSTLMDEAADVARTAGDAVLAITGGGFRDVTRLAGSDPDLWVGIVSGNERAVLAAIDAFAARLGDLRRAIAGQQWDELRRFLERARAARSGLPSKAQVTSVTDVVVPLADRPGMLAEVTTALGAAGVNIEDLSMRHASDGTRGALLVSVASGAAASRAREILAERAIPCHLEAHG